MGKRRTLRRVLGVILTAAMCAVLFLGLSSTGTKAAGGRFQVNGTKLYDANGNEFIMRGVNYPHAWYTSEYQTAIPAIASKGFNCIRLVLADGQKYTKTSYDELSSLISTCKQNNLVAIVEVHDATGEDSTGYLDNAVNYWLEMKKLLQENEAYVIVNIANEWYGTWDDGSSWENGYVNAIKKMRNAGINNTIMVDCAGWGQYPKVIFDHGNNVLNADPLKNTMFSIHMYEYAGGNASTVRSNIDNVLNNNLCLTIGEFGGQHTDGDVDEDTIMSYSRSKNVGWLAWSWKGNSQSLYFLDMANDWSGNSLTSFGDRVINGNDGIKATSRMCSVFNGISQPDQGDSGNTSGSGNTGSQPSESGKTNIFYGSSYADNWAQAVSVSTKKNGGAANVTDMNSGSYIWVEYTGAYADFDLVFESFSGGNSWAKISPSESGSTSNGTYYAKFNYNDIVNVYGSNFSTVDKVHVSSHVSGITVKSVDIVTGGNSGNTGNTGDSGNTGNTGNTGSQPSESGKTNIFSGSSYADNWAQAVSVSTKKNGGAANVTDMNSGSYIWVEYTGAYADFDLVFESFSGGNSWAKISPSESGSTSNGTYYAKFNYNDIVNVYGSNFSTVDKVHVSSHVSGITVKSVDIVK